MLLKLEIINYESVIHEFDSYFNYRVTQFLRKNGIYDFWNFFDDRTRYPLGCVVGGTLSQFTFTSGLVGYPSDDINKFLWIVRIGGGVFPHIKEADYLNI
ncbi:hypothetical protein Leryth_001093 [Lithospermum erythrorhizon]|nr:hypothetical protein Leryth_001093 [Lithospermum erythrorhizon]